MSRGPVQLWSASVGLAAQMKAVEREIVMRERVYPGLVLARKMDSKKAGYEIASMKAVLETLEALAERSRRLTVRHPAGHRAARLAAPTEWWLSG